MEHLIHTLPTEHQTADIDHVRLDEATLYATRIDVQLTYGTTDADDNFQPHPLNDKPHLSPSISVDLDAFDEEPSMNEVAPDMRGDSVRHLAYDVVAYADANNLWHT